MTALKPVDSAVDNSSNFTKVGKVEIVRMLLTVFKSILVI